MKKKIVLAAAVGLLVIVVIIAAVSGKKPKDGLGMSELSDDRVKHQVSFYASDGEIILVDSVPEGSAATPPEIPVMKYGDCFMQWKTDFSCVTEDMDVYPEIEHIEGKKNAFIFPSAYGRKDNTVTVPLQLSGDVLLSGFDLTIGYDEKQLEFEEIRNEDGELVCNAETPGEIHMNFATARNVEADIDICHLVFRVLSENGEIPVQMTVNSIYKVNEEGNLIPADFDIVQGKIYVY